MKKIFVLVLSVSLFSCKYYATKKYHLNNRFDFKTKSKYLDAFKNKKIGESLNLLYIDSADYLNFYVNKMSNDSAVAYLGCFLNDSTAVRKSESLSYNTSCSGRIQNEIKTNLMMNKDSIRYNCKREHIRDYKFREVATGNLVNFNSDDEMKIMLIYASGFGSYYDELYKWIIKSKQESKMKSKVYFISIDPLYQLK
jgi:hypothetical protein